MQQTFYIILKTEALHGTRDGAEQYAGDLECVFYGYHLDGAILKIAEAAYCLMPSQHGTSAKLHRQDFLLAPVCSGSFLAEISVSSP